VVDNSRDERGQAATYDAIHAIRAELVKALAGWEPEPDYRAIQYEGGNLLDMDRSRLYYQFEFSASFEFNEEDTRQWDDHEALAEFDTLAVGVDLIDPGDGPDGRIEHQLNIQPNIKSNE